MNISQRTLFQQRRDEAGAVLEGPHRYHLWRHWNQSLSTVGWILLNPSTANAHEDDATVRKCSAFARRWGFGGIDILNLYTYRTKSPAMLRAAGYLNGPDCDLWINRVLSSGQVGMLVLGWGQHAEPQRVGEVLAIATRWDFRPYALRLVGNGQPWHPLYLPYEVRKIALQEHHLRAMSAPERGRT